jgi:predicted transcriptional regulator
MNLGFYKNKGLSIVLLLVCIIGSVMVDSIMKPKEGFQEGATDKKSSNESEVKSSINKILSSSDTPTEQCKQIMQVIGDYLMKEEKTTSTINQIMSVLGMNTTDTKKINLISVLLTNDNL